MDDFIKIKNEHPTEDQQARERVSISCRMKLLLSYFARVRNQSLYSIGSSATYNNLSGYVNYHGKYNIFHEVTLHMGVGCWIPEIQHPEIKHPEYSVEYSVDEYNVIQILPGDNILVGIEVDPVSESDKKRLNLE